MKLNLMSYSDLRKRLKLSVGVTKEAIIRELDRRDRTQMTVSRYGVIGTTKNKNYQQPLVSYL